MYHKLFVLASFALAIVNAHPGSHVARATTSTFKFSETFPEAGSIPTAKPEWLELIKGANTTDAPVYTNTDGLGPQQEKEGEDPYCDWTFTGCFGKDDLYECPKGQWALTYDDGPSEYSPKLYDYLDKVKVKATFFMVGGQVVQFPEHALRAYKSGHEIAMHTWSHSYMTTLTNEQIVAELKWNELAIKEVTGVSPKYFRPPYGDIDDRVRNVAAALGFIPIIWNHDTNDWAAASSPKTFKESWIDGNATQWAHNAKKAKVGGVSLEHDLYEKTVKAAIRILPILQKSYELTPVGACNKVEMYKGNSTETATTSASAVPSSVPSSVPSAAATADAAGTTTIHLDASATPVAEAPAAEAPAAETPTVAPVDATTVDSTANAATAENAGAAEGVPVAANVAVNSGASVISSSTFGLGVAAVAAFALL
ncbi:hypothetical protein G6F56_006048 [Rhizopus delemar]|nr:hypothetical protein G6F56_006048 [Rhizopus delemar]